MNTIKISLFMIISLFFLSCTQENSTQYSEISEDPLFSEYMSNIELLLEQEGKPEVSNLNLSAKEIEEEFKNSDNLEESLGKYVENADYVLESLRSAYSLAIELKDRYPEISDSDFDVTQLVEANVGISSLYKGGDACLRQHTIDIDSCKTQALVGAAVCGLSSATIVGALACGAGVVAYRSICGSTAEKTYENCRSKNN